MTVHRQNIGNVSKIATNVKRVDIVLDTSNSDIIFVIYIAQRFMVTKITKYHMYYSSNIRNIDSTSTKYQ